ncbi:MAG: hypothetical protein AAF553_03615 [Pseudomonadota bacterium]
MTTDFSLLTHIMRAEHLAVLDDWLDFIGHAPRRIIAVTSPGADVKESVRSWSAQKGTPMELAGECESSLIGPSETDYLNQQFEVAGSDLVMLVKLDTFPAREGHESWFKESMSLMGTTGAQFLTGSTKPFRADGPTTDADHLITRRISNNFLVIEAPVWRRFQKLGRELDHDFGRFYTEGAVEHICQRDGGFGIRRLNTSSWRVFHTQVWDDRATAIREAVKTGGAALGPFLDGFEDDLFGKPAWERYFMYPRPSRLKLLRIALGRWRRRFGSGSS